jgi:ribosomal protein S18 acetylase RimI-like enzyme
VSWGEVVESGRRRELLASAIRRAYAAKAAAERREIPVAESDSGEIWAMADGSATAWVLPSESDVVIADLASTVQDPAAVWTMLEDLAATAGWTGIWRFSAYEGQEMMAALAASAPATRVATKMRVTVAGVPVPEGIGLRPMDTADYEAFRAVSDEEYAQERFDSGSEPTLEEARRVAAEQMVELLPDGLQTVGNRLWVVQDADGRRAGILWLHLRDDEAFIYDIAMDEDRRGQGLGTQALRAAAAETARAGLRVLALNVFGSNESARRLYIREGYRTTEILWSVPIGPR